MPALLLPSNRGVPLPSSALDLSSPSLVDLHQLVDDIRTLPNKYRRKRSLAGEYDDGLSWIEGTNPLFWIPVLAMHHQEKSLHNCGSELRAWMQVYMGLQFLQDGQ